MKTLRSHVIENANANSARGVRKKRWRDREPAAETEPVRLIRSIGLDGASVSLPANIDLATRAERKPGLRPGLSKTFRCRDRGRHSRRSLTLLPRRQAPVSIPRMSPAH